MKYTLNRNTEGFVLSVAHTQHDDVEILNLETIEGKYLSCCKLNELTHMLEVDEAKKTEVDNAENKLKLVEELNQCENKLKELDYIGTKIATGRATVEDYSEEINEMNKLAERVSEIRELIK